MSIDTTFSYIAKLEIEESNVIVSCDEDLITSLECTYVALNHLATALRTMYSYIYMLAKSH